jgi:voltage-gated potassium channel Kch
MSLSEAYYESVERRIEWLTLALGGLASPAAVWRWGWRAGIGLAFGAVLAWLNFRWLDRGVGALLRAAAAPSPSVPASASRWIYVRFLARMALLVGAVYVILRGAWFPGRAVLVGLFSLIGAVLLEVTYEVVTGFREPRARE